MKITEVTANQKLNEFVFIPAVVAGLAMVARGIVFAGIVLSLIDIYQIYRKLKSGEMTREEAVKEIGKEAAYALASIAVLKGAAMGFRAFKRHWKKATAGTAGVGVGTGVAAQTDEPIKENLAKGLRAIFNVVKNFDEYKKEVFSILRRSPKFKHLSDEKIEKMSHTITTAETSKRAGRSAAPDNFNYRQELYQRDFDRGDYLQSVDD